MRTIRVDEDWRRCETDGCTQIAEARDFYCLRCHLTGRAPSLKTSAVDMGERARLYEAKCMMCGRSQEWSLTLEQRKKMRAGTCEFCGGAKLIEESEFGSLGSAIGSRLKYG
jgi:transcription elongation factor Elf1